VITASNRAPADQARPRAGLVCTSSRHRSKVCTDTPTSRDTTPISALSGANKRDTTLFLKASPYLAIFRPYRPQVNNHIGATTILTQGAVVWTTAAETQPKPTFQTTRMKPHPTLLRIKFSDVSVGQRFYDPISAEYFVKQDATMAAMVTGQGDGTVADEFEVDDVVGVEQA
jgi:hypothetical protein